AGEIALVLARFVGVWVTRPPTIVESHLAGPELPPTDEKGEAVRPDPIQYRPVRVVRHVAESDPSADSPIAAAKPERVVSPPADIVAFVDRQIAQGWEDAGLTSSGPATDAEWLRRVYL